MTPDSASSYESQRLKALLSYQILDTASEQDFDDLTELASVICQTPIALISFVDQDRQWFKSRKGLEPSETDRADSFCAHAILNPEEIMEIPDANVDPRFQENPLVTGDPHIVFYAGMPLVDQEGNALGSICVIDRHQKTLTPAQKNALKLLSKQVMEKLELRKLVQSLSRERAAIAEDSAQLRLQHDQSKQQSRIAQEVNEQLKQAHHLIGLNEESLRLTVEAAKLGMYNLDLQTGLVTVNQYCREIFGFPDDMVVTAQDGFNLMAEDQNRIEKAMAYAIANRTIFEEEYRVVNRMDQVIRWVRSVGRALEGSNGKTLSFYGTLVDITERKKSDQRKNDFIGMVSHELKSPLTAMKGYLQLLDSRAKNLAEGKLTPLIQKTHRMADRMNQIISSFLDIARFDDGKLQLQKTSFNAGSFLEQIVEEYEDTLERHELRIANYAAIELYADKNKIEQILVNFISNAIKYTPDGGVVEINSVRVGNELKFSVTDTGIGLSEAHLAKVFDRFYRVDTEQTQGIDGFGIGLYICKEIIELHQGTIGVISTLGQGSTFWFTLPIAEHLG